MSSSVVKENLWDLVTKFFLILVAILIVMFVKTAYNVYHIPSQLRRVQESLERAIEKHQERLNEHENQDGGQGAADQAVENSEDPVENEENIQTLDKDKDL